MHTGLRPQKLLAASGARIAPGGESGWFQWLVPGLVVMVVLFAAVTVRSEADHASKASTTATNAQAFRAAVRESAALKEAVLASRGNNASIKAQADASFARMRAAFAPLEQGTGGDPEVESLGRMAAIAGRDADARPAHERGRRHRQALRRRLAQRPGARAAAPDLHASRRRATGGADAVVVLLQAGTGGARGARERGPRRGATGSRGEDPPPGLPRLAHRPRQPRALRGPR